MVVKDFLFAIRSLINFFFMRAVKRNVFVSVLLPRNEILFSGMQIEVRVEDGMKCDLPELVFMCRVLPERIRTIDNRLPQHLEGGVVLGFDDLFYFHVLTFRILTAMLH